MVTGISLKESSCEPLWKLLQVPPQNHPANSTEQAVVPKGATRSSFHTVFGPKLPELLKSVIILSQALNPGSELNPKPDRGGSKKELSMMARLP